MNTLQNKNNLENRGSLFRGVPRLRFTLLGVAMVAFGLLIWSRLLLVTSYPKTAIADPPRPRVQAQNGTVQASAPGADSNHSGSRR